MSGSDITIFATGHLVWEALNASKISFSVKDVDGIWINPTGLDEES